MFIPSLRYHLSELFRNHIAKHSVSLSWKMSSRRERTIRNEKQSYELQAYSFIIVLS